MAHTFASGGTSEPGIGEYDDPWGIALSPDGTLLYIADYNNNRIQVTDLMGVYQRTLGSEGDGAGELDTPQFCRAEVQ